MKTPAWQRRWIDVTAWALLLTGVLWLGVHYARPDDALPSPLEPWLMRLHGLAGFAVLIGAGLFASHHAPARWHRRVRRGVAGTMAAGLALAIVSAYVLYYFAPEPSRAWIGIAHAAVASAWVALLYVHRRR